MAIPGWIVFVVPEVGADSLCVMLTATSRGARGISTISAAWRLQRTMLRGLTKRGVRVALHVSRKDL